MNNFFEQFKKHGQEIKLSTAEKSAMKARIFGAPSYTPTPSQYVPFSFSLSIHLRSALAALVIFVLVGSSTAYAAEGALPGQPLYTVKINVNEKVETALAVTPEQQAVVHAALAQRRVEEAEALAAQGALDATTSAELSANFAVHAQALASSTAELAQNDPAAAAQVQTQFDSSIEAHGQILAQLGDQSASSSVRTNSAAVVRTVLALANHERKSEDAQQSADSANSAGSTTTLAVATVHPTAMVRTFAATAPVPQATTSAAKVRPQNDNATSTQDAHEQVAAALEARVSIALSAVQAQYGQLKPTLSADSVSKIDSRLATTSVFISNASAELGAKDYVDAQVDFTKAYRLVTELSAYLGAQQKYQKQNILPGLLQQSDTQNNSDTRGSASGNVSSGIALPQSPLGN